MRNTIIMIPPIFISILAILIGCGPEDPNAEYFAGTETALAPVVEAAKSCENGQCEVARDPDTKKTVQLPDIIEVKPTKIIETQEKQISTDIIDYHTTRHIWQPVEQRHTIHEHKNILRRHFVTVVVHPEPPPFPYVYPY